MPARTASSTTYWMAGLSTTGNISLGCALVAGRNRVPRPAAGITALVTARGGVDVMCFLSDRQKGGLAPTSDFHRCGEPRLYGAHRHS